MPRLATAFAVRVEFHPGALDDIFEASVEYESRRRLLGERFVATVTSAAEWLEEFPRKGTVLPTDGSMAPASS